MGGVFAWKSERPSEPPRIFDSNLDFYSGVGPGHTPYSADAQSLFWGLQHLGTITLFLSMRNHYPFRGDLTNREKRFDIRPLYGGPSSVYGVPAWPLLGDTPFIFALLIERKWGRPGSYFLFIVGYPLCWLLVSRFTEPDR